MDISTLLEGSGQQSRQVAEEERRRLALEAIRRNQLDTAFPAVGPTPFPLLPPSGPRRVDAMTFKPDPFAIREGLTELKPQELYYTKDGQTMAMLPKAGPTEISQFMKPGVGADVGSTPGAAVQVGRTPVGGKGGGAMQPEAPKSEFDASLLGMAIAGLGQTVAGQPSDLSFFDRLRQEKAARTEKGLNLKKEMARIAEMEDPSSAMSKQLQDFMRPILGDAVNNVSYRTLKENAGQVVDYYEKMRMMQMKKGGAGAPASTAPAAIADFVKKYEKKGAEERGKISYTNDALNAVRDLKAIVADPKEPLRPGIPGFGATKFELADRTFRENFGRFQSGGAITGTEMASFAQFVPRFMDSREMKQYKLEKLNKMLEDRLASYGAPKNKLDAYIAWQKSSELPTTAATAKETAKTTEKATTKEPEKVAGKGGAPKSAGLSALDKI